MCVLTRSASFLSVQVGSAVRRALMRPPVATSTECCGGNIDRQRVLRIAVVLAVRKKPLGAVESAGAWRRRPTLT